MLDPVLPLSHPRVTPPRDKTDAQLHRLAQDLEAAFLFEMLGHVGLDQTHSGFDGGIGETQFASFLRREQANAMARSGGIGLAETLFQAMTGGRDDEARG